QGVLDVEQSAHPHALGDTEGRFADPLDHRVAQRDRRQGAGGVAGVDAGLLDVLHDAADVEVSAVVERVDVDLDGGVQEPVDQDRGLGTAAVGQVAADVVDQARLVVDDLHAAPAQHVAGAHQDRIAHRGGDLGGVGEAPRGAVGRGGQVRIGQHRPEVAPVLGGVDRA